MNDFLYGFVDENNRVLDFFVVKEDDFDTLENLKLGCNAIAYYKVQDISKEISGPKEEQYWNGERFTWDELLPSWIFDDSIGSWTPPVPYPDDGKKYFWDEDILQWEEVSE